MTVRKKLIDWHDAEGKQLTMGQVLDGTIAFGKNQGQKWSSVSAGYLRWLVTEFGPDNYADRMRRGNPHLVATMELVRRAINKTPRVLQGADLYLALRMSLTGLMHKTLHKDYPTTCDTIIRELSDRLRIHLKKDGNESARSEQKILQSTSTMLAGWVDTCERQSQSLDDLVSTIRKEHEAYYKEYGNAVSSSGAAPEPAPVQEPQPAPAPAPAPAPSGSGLDAIFQHAVQSFVQQNLQDLVAGQVESSIAQHVKAAMADVEPGIAEIKMIDAETLQELRSWKPKSGTVHKQLPRVLELAQAGQNILLHGPTGTGKTYLARQLAEALGRSFHAVSVTGGVSEGQVIGRWLPTGDNGQFQWMDGPFLTAWRNGGVFLADEYDAADPNVACKLNMALSNGIVETPEGLVEKHQDFVFVAAVNTWGNGGGRDYSGRNVQDLAVLKRFTVGKVSVGYDEAVEAEVCPDAKLRTRLTDIRKKAVEKGLPHRQMTTRDIADGYRMRAAAGWTEDQVIEALTLDWTQDERKALGVPA